MGNQWTALTLFVGVLVVFLPATAMGGSEQIPGPDVERSAEMQAAGSELDAALKALRRLQRPLQAAAALSRPASEGCSGGGTGPSLQRMNATRGDLISVRRELRQLQSRYRQGDLRQDDLGSIRRLTQRSRDLGSKIVTSLAQARSDRRIEGWSNPATPTGGGSVSGTVTEDGTGTPLENISIDIFNNCGNFVGYGYSDSAGSFSVGGLGTGGHYARAADFTSGHITELFDDVRCADFCDAREGDRIQVTDGIDTPGIDFALDPSGTISGTVTEEGTGDPLAFVSVYIYDGAGGFVGSTSTDFAGAFTLGGLVTGTYFSRTSIFSATHVDELFDDILCPGGSCDETTGTPIAVTEGSNTSGIDFVVAPGGSISGTVTEEGTGDPVVSASVDVYDSDGNYINFGFTDGTGAFSVGGLPSGNYFAVFYSPFGSNLLDELYNNFPCPNGSCDVTMGTAIAVILGSNTAGVDIALSPGGSISGTVTEEGSGDPLEDLQVTIYDSDGFWIGSTSTDVTGAFSVGGLATGDHFARAFPSDSNHIGELYDDIPCPRFCSPTTGTSIAVVQGSDTSGVDFALDPGGAISGTVTQEGTGTPIANVSIDIYDSGGSYVGYAYTDLGGGFSVGGLTTGSFFATAYLYPFYGNFVGELWDDFPCPGLSCDETTGTPIAVTLGSETSGTDFALSPGGAVSGTVTDAATGDPLCGTDVDIFDLNGVWVSYGYADGTGSYSATGLSTGTHFARTDLSGFFANHFVDELWDDIPCPGGSCDPPTGSPIAVAQGSETSGIDFGLGLGGTVTGMVTEDGTGTPLPNTLVYLYDSSGGFVASDWTDGAGVFGMGGLTTGDYFAKAPVNSSDYIPELYDDILCPGSCDVTTGTPIGVTLGSETSGIDFALSMGGSISGTVADERTGSPLLGVEVDIYNSSGSYVGYAYTDATGAYTAGGLITGDYFARTWVAGINSDFLDELFDDIPCTGGCPITTGTPIAVTLDTNSPGVDFDLVDGSLIFADGFESGDTSAWSNGVP